MKKLVIIILFLLLYTCNKKVNTNYILLSGTIENTKSKHITIGNEDFKTEVEINQDGTFSDTLHIPEHGFYTMTISKEYTPIYLTFNDNLTVSVDAKQIDQTISYSGKGAIENNYLASKTLYNNQITGKSIQFFALEEANFKAELDKMQSTNNTRLDGLMNADEHFITTEKQNLIYDRYAQINKYIQRHGYYAEKEHFEVSEHFIPVELKNMTFDNSNAYKSSMSYKNMAFDNALTAIFNDLGDDISSVIPKDLNSVQNLKIPALKNKIIDYLSMYLMSPGNKNMEIIYNFLSANTADEDLKHKLRTIFDKNINLVKGKPSPHFVNYENHKGGAVSLTDLKGKFVYIDVWAQWCGPCIAEIPALKNIEKTFHNKNIAFVSTSIDQAKDRQKWSTMIKNKNLGGIQLLADNNWDSKFIKAYGIQGIPRFILIDPKGDIVSADAPRPSDPKLLELLEKELKLQL
jgi:thiol-disulfide isomerase/thioredoxin